MLVTAEGRGQKVEGSIIENQQNFNNLVQLALEVNIDCKEGCRYKGTDMHLKEFARPTEKSKNSR
jgi:hypothetical protein